MSKKQAGTLDVLLNAQAQAALDNFSTCFGVRIAYYKPDQTELQVGLEKRCCGYCAYLRKRLIGDARCLEQDRVKFGEAFQRRTLIHYTCHGGLVEAICPVMLDQTLVGYVMVGQFRTQDRIPDAVCLAVKRKNWRIDEVGKAFERVPKIQPEILPAMLALFSLLVKAIVREGIAAVHGDLIVERILYEIRRQPEKSLTLPDAARLVGRSRSSVSHLFQSKLGRSFKSCVVDIRLEKAEELLRHTPGITVKEAAARVGFDDVCYFSRIFRKRKGYPPSSCGWNGLGACPTGS